MIQGTGTRRWSVGSSLALLLALPLAASACALDAGPGTELAPPPAETGGAGGLEDPGAGAEPFEQIVLWVESERELLGSDPWSPAGGFPPDPCDCTSPGCLQDWANEYLGCNVCVSLYCEGEPGPHVCHACDGTSTRL